MPKRLREKNLALIVDIVRQSTDGERRSDIAKALKEVPQRTLQYWLKSLVEGRLTQEGKGPAARYRLPGAVEEQEETVARQAGPEVERPEETVVPLSAESGKIRDYLRQPSGARKETMHTTNLRKVGGSIMLAVPRAILDLLHLDAGATVGLAVDGERLVVQPQPRYMLDQPLAQCDRDAEITAEDRAWIDFAPSGREL